MSELVVDQIRALQARSSNIRNVSIVSCFGHGKSTITDTLVKKAGFMPHDTTSDPYHTSTQGGQDGRDITIRSIPVPLHFELKKEELDTIEQKTDGPEFLINLLDTPGHSDFLADVTAALRISDGAIVVVDCIEGVGIQLEAIIRRMLEEGIKSVVVINKVDRAVLEHQVSKEDLFQSFSRVIEFINVFISAYQDTPVGDTKVSPDQGTVAFGSGLHGWAFTLRQFVTRYCKKFGVDKDKMMKMLWGDHYFDPKTKKWGNQPTGPEGRPLERAFNMFVLDPIFKIFDAIMNSKKEYLETILQKLDINLTPDERDLEGTTLLKVVMNKFVPVEETLLEMIVIHLPSPLTAQNYRVHTLYEGPMDDESAVAIRNCDPSGPLVFYVSQIISTSNKDRFYAFGRVFAGTVRPEMEVRIQGPKYVVGKKKDLFVKTVSQVMLIGSHSMELTDCPAGNLVSLLGIDQFLLGPGTITTSKAVHNIRSLKSTVSPVVHVAIDIKKPVDLLKLLEGLKRLSKSDFGIQAWTSETGEHIVAGASEFHVDIRLKELESDHAGIPIKRSDPFVAYRETVRAESSMVAMSKSPNKHNRLFVKAQPLEEELCIAIEAGKIDPRSDTKDRARILAEDYGWDVPDARKIWAFGPDETGPNVFVDVTKSVQHVNEIRDSCNSAFQWATKEGVCSEESMRGIRFNLLDAFHFSDAIRRGSGQIIPTCRRVCYAACLLAEPTLQEPIYLVEIQCPKSRLGDVYSVLTKRRGKLLSEEEGPGSAMIHVKAYLPIAESFGFTANLGSQTDQKTLCQYIFNHWELMDGSALDKGSSVEEIVMNIRIRKGLKPEIPSVHKYHDTL